METDRYRLSVRSAGKAPLVLKGTAVNHPERLPKQFRRTIVEVNKQALSEALQQDDKTAQRYAQFGDLSRYVVIK